MICPHCTKEITEEDIEKQKTLENKKVQNEFMQKLFSSIVSGKKENTKAVIQEYNSKLVVNNGK